LTLPWTAILSNIPILQTQPELPYGNLIFIKVRPRMFI